MSWDAPTDDEISDGAAVAVLASLQAIAVVARQALITTSGERFRQRVGDLLLVQLDALDASIEQYRLAANAERLRRDDELF